MMRPKSVEKEEAIVTIALQIIQEEGLENLTMQKLAKAANISPRTIYLKYENKEDLLIKLFIDEVMGAYEAAGLQGFDEKMDFTTGMKRLWLNGFRYFRDNRSAFALMRYGMSSPLLFKAFQDRNIQQGAFFGPVDRFLEAQVKAGVIRDLPHDILRALLFSPVYDLINEYFDYSVRPQQIITEEVILTCCEIVIKGITL